MLLFEQIFLALIAVHLFTIIGFYLVKRSKISDIFKSSSDHPANIGNSAAQLGGLVIVPITLCACFFIFYSLKNIPMDTQLIMCIPFIVLFLVGIVDDFNPIPAWIRLTLHFANAISVAIILYHVSKFSGLDELTSMLGFIVPSIFMVLAISWMINTVNFIDGMDLFLVANILPGCILFAVLGFNSPGLYYISVIFLVFTSSLLGFIWFNRPKASIYMGDAGTLCIGLLLSSSAVYIFAKYGSIAGFIPFTYILVDTTFTLIYRAQTGQNVLKSHNQHAYQVALRNGKTENSIRLNCFIATVLNTSMASICFVLDHSIFGQISMALIALAISTYVYFFFRKQNAKTA